MNCKEYQDDLKRRAQNDEAARQTQQFLEVNNKKKAAVDWRGDVLASWFVGSAVCLWDRVRALCRGHCPRPPPSTHVQYTQTDTNRQETLTSGTIGKKSLFVKEALRFAPLVRMKSSSVHWYTICKLHLITT